MSVLSVCTYVYAPRAGLVPSEARRGVLIPGDWSDWQLRATKWVLEIDSLEEPPEFFTE